MPAASQRESAASSQRADGTSAPAVTVAALSKTFSIPHSQASTLKERVLHPRASARRKLLEALHDVSFEVPQGEFFGIVGRNGSGKSTLLKCLAGIYEPTVGSVDVRGRLGTFIELGVGFNPELAARDNVMVNATMMGLTRKQAAARFPAIMEFAELEEFRDLKLKNYSSGMHVRLAFSTAIQIETDVLLVDEVLAVGDSAFQQKCYEQFQRLKDERRTILFVTHDMSAVARFCDRAMLLERGRMVMIDDPVTVGRRYHELNFNRGHEEQLVEGEERYGDREEGELADVWFEQPAGHRCEALLSGAPAQVCLEVWTRQRLENPVFNVELRNGARQPLFVASSQYQEGMPKVLEAGRRYVVRLSFDCVLGPDRYYCTPALLRGLGAEDIVDLKPNAASVMIHAVNATGGLVEIPHEFRVEEA